MAKVTEQDLLDRGFEKKLYPFKMRNPINYWYKKEYQHIVCGTIGIEVFFENEKWFIKIIGFDSIKPLTHANLDLFIRFAKGEKL